MRKAPHTIDIIEIIIPIILMILAIVFIILLHYFKFNLRRLIVRPFYFGE